MQSIRENDFDNGDKKKRRQVKLDTVIQAPTPEAARLEHHGFVHRVKGFFKSIFQ